MSEFDLATLAGHVAEIQKLPTQKARDAATEKIPGFASLDGRARNEVLNTISLVPPTVEETTERKPVTPTQIALVARLARMTEPELLKESPLSRLIASDCGLDAERQRLAGLSKIPARDFAGEIAALEAARDAADARGDWATGGVIQARIYTAERAAREASGDTP